MGEVGHVFVLKVPDYKFAMLIYLYKVILEKNNPNRTSTIKNSEKSENITIYSAENAVISFHKLKTTPYAGNDRHRPEDKPSALHHIRGETCPNIVRVITLISRVMFARKAAKLCGLLP